MRIETHGDLLLDEVEVAFGHAVDDTLEEARRIASRHSRTGTFERSIETTEVAVGEDALTSRVGSPLRSAKVKEKGGYIRARKAPLLVFDAGQGVRRVKAVRLAPQPAVTPAGRRYPEVLLDRLREAHG